MTSLKVINYPKVTSDNCLEFDPNGPVPLQIPYFKKHEQYPWKFIPIFEDCISRTTRTAKLNSCQTCNQTREVWYCSKLNIDVFPITCAKCEVRDAN